MSDKNSATRTGPERVADAAAALGLAIQIIEHAKPTRTAEEAAAAAGCALGQIIKSLVFRGAESGRPVLILVSGANRVDPEALVESLGEAVVRPDADYVRAVTGYAIGGIPPFGHATPMTTLIDRDLLAYDRVWAAAGSPRTVFEIAPGLLAEKTGAKAATIAAREGA